MRKEKRETFNNQRPLQEENRNQAKNTEEKKMWLAFLVIRYLNIIIVLVFGKKRKKHF